MTDLRVELLPDGRLAAGPRPALTTEVRAQLRELAALVRQARVRLGWNEDDARRCLAEHVPQGVPTAIAALRAQLAAAESPSPRAESRRRRALALLAERPERKRAMVTDPDDPAHPGDVVLTIALRTDDGPVTAELLLPRDRYDPFLLLDLFDRYSRQQ